MNYLICQDWHNTSNNHAGMKYLCLYLEKTYPNEFKTIIITQLKQKYGNNRIVNKIKSLKFKFSQKKKNKQTAKKLINQLSSNDSIFLMEYLDPNVNQFIIAQTIRKKFPNIQIYGISHLVPSKLNKLFSDYKLQKWQNIVDKIITLGSSLSNYYISRGISKEKLITTFHYVDKFYINPQIEKHNNFSIIVMGNQMRDINLLTEIVRNNPNIQFTICQGTANLSNTFSTPNVKLTPFVTEQELRKLMKEADVSLNVMHDTIGSNVIVTSMGMGLAMLCSDVGSIRDYCDIKNTIFCSSLTDFNSAIKLLSQNPDLLFSLREQAKNKALNFSIENFYQDIKKQLHVKY